MPTYDVMVDRTVTQWKPMPSRAVVQPNGRYAIFSSNVDTFIAYDGTRDEILGVFREEFRAQADRNAEEKMRRADERNRISGADFSDALRTVALVHGGAESVRLECLMSADSDARAARSGPPQAETEVTAGDFIPRCDECESVILMPLGRCPNFPACKFGDKNARDMMARFGEVKP